MFVLEDVLARFRENSRFEEAVLDLLGLRLPGNIPGFRSRGRIGLRLPGNKPGIRTRGRRTWTQIHVAWTPTLFFA
jgi:hypothetical protein